MADSSGGSKDEVLEAPARRKSGGGRASERDPLSDSQRAYLTLLFNRYRGSLYRYLSGLVESTEDANDLVQETYFRVMRRGEEAVRFEAVARSYLFQTATNLAREHYRRRAARRADEHVSLDEAVGLPDDRVPDQIVAWEDAIARIRRELAAMPPALRDILLLSRFQRRTCPQIAASLGVSTRTVERRLSQALDYLIARMRGVL